MPKKKKKPLRGVVPGLSKFAAVCARAALSSSNVSRAGGSVVFPSAAAPLVVASEAASDPPASLSPDPVSDLMLVSGPVPDLLPVSLGSSSTVDGPASGVELSLPSVATPGVSAASVDQLTAIVTDLVNPPKATVHITSLLGPESTSSVLTEAVITTAKQGETAVVVAGPAPPVSQELGVGANLWVDRVKVSSKKLSRKGSAFTLPSGELCVKIPNSVIERNKRSWDFFILG